MVYPSPGGARGKGRGGRTKALGCFTWQSRELVPAAPVPGTHVSQQTRRVAPSVPVQELQEALYAFLV